VCGQLDKPALLDWAWRLGQEGKDWREERDGAGDRGTDVHDMIMAFWKGEEVQMVGEIQTKCFENFLGWLKGHKITPVIVEQPFVSEKLRFGGQPDLVAVIDDVLTLLDIKTSKGVYDNFWYQLAGYELLLNEHGHKPKQFQILRLGQDGTVDDPVRKKLTNEKRIFKALLNIYYWRRNDKP
jgi:hypothetical protein